jgi:hypothetical protein
MVRRMAVAQDEPIRLLVVGLSTLARELIETATGTDIELVDSPPGSANLGEAIHETHADFVLVPLEPASLPTEARRYLARQAHVRVLGVHEQMGRAFLYQLVPETKELGEVAPAELLDAIRNAAAAEQEAG